MKRNFTAGINSILILPRRWGKPSLVKKAINEVREDKQTELTFGISLEEIKRNPDDILELAQRIAIKKKIKIIICIDEFQSIMRFTDADDFQKKLHSHWQHHSKVTYCLYGSKKHILLDVFTNPSMPFYKFGDIMYIQKIKTEDWLPFIEKRFLETEKKNHTREHFTYHTIS